MPPALWREIELRLALPEDMEGGAGKSWRSIELRELNPSIESVCELQLISSELMLDEDCEGCRDTMDAHLEEELS